MKTYQFLLMAIKINLHKVVGAELPCSTANGLPVIDVCSARNVNQDLNTHNILLKVTSEQECQCQLTNSHNSEPFNVEIRKFDGLLSSSPSEYRCGVIVLFAVKDNILYKAECVTNPQSYKYTVPADNILDIRTLHVNGSLKKNEGYCIEIKSNNIVLQCTNTIVPTSETLMPSISDSTTSKSLILGSTMQLNKTDVEVTKTNYNYISNVTATSFRDSDTVLYISVGAAVIGTLGLVLVVLVVARRLYYRKKTKQDAPQSEVNVDRDVVYDGLQYNILYVPSTNNLQQEQGTTNQSRQQMSIDTTDGTYSTADFAVPSGSIFAITDDKNSCINTCIKDEGIPMKLNKTQKPKNNDIYSIPDKKKIKHISVPGNEACEYAVVDKKLEN